MKVLSKLLFVGLILFVAQFKAAEPNFGITKESFQENEEEKKADGETKGGDDGDIVEAKSYHNMKLDVRKADAICFIIDQSPSMIDDIKEIVKHVDSMLEAVDVKKVPISIVAYADVAEVVLKSSRDIAAIKQAFDDIEGAAASKESLFDAIMTGYKIIKKHKTPEFVIVTDETGDDSEEMDRVIKTIRKKCRAHVISTDATFGNDEWRWSVLVDRTKGATEHYKSSNGPASGTPEIFYDFFFVQRSFITEEMAPYNTKRWAIPSGYAPYTLGYLAEATKGVVYLIPTDTYKLGAGNFDKRLKKKYKPQLLKRSDLSRMLKKDMRRKAVHDALTAYYKGRQEMVRGQTLGSPSSTEDVKKREISAFVNSNMGAVDKNMKLLEKMIETLEKGMEGFAKKSNTKSYISKGIPDHKRWQANIELNYAMAFCAYYEMLQYKKFCAEVDAGKIDLRGGGSADDPNNLGKAPMDTLMRVELLMVPGDSTDDGNVKESYIDNSSLVKIVGAVKKIQGKSKISKLSMKEIGEIADRTLKIVEENHANTPWASTANMARKSMGPYAFLAYIVGNSSNTKQNQ